MRNPFQSKMPDRQTRSTRRPAPRSAAPLLLHAGSHVIRSRPDGTVEPAARDGYFVDDTRLISRLAWRLGGEPFRMRSRSGNAIDRATLVLEAGGARALVRRRLAPDGVSERIRIEAGLQPVAATLALELEADFADIFEVRGLTPTRERRPDAAWAAPRRELRWRYAHGAFRREIGVLVESADSPPRRTPGGLAFEIDIGAGDHWEAQIRLVPGPLDLRPTTTPVPPVRHTRLPEPGPSIEAGDRRAWSRAIADLASLELPDHRPARAAVSIAAGIPWYAALFGRDALIASLLALPVRPDLARGTLIRLAELQATGFDREREMEPGKIPHELRRGELATLGLIPFRPYYGSHDATPLFLVLLGATWEATRDSALVRALWPHALAALTWIDRHGDRDGDGLQEYAPSSPGGFPHQGWRDSADGTVGAGGSPVPHPIALAEHQGYVYDAKLRIADVAAACMGDQALAARLRDDAAGLRARLDERFWWPEERTYALGLDGDGQQIRSVTSAGGHLLWSGIVPPERAPLIARRLAAPDLDSGWGLRTLSRRHPAYDPHSYHRGSVWPHDTAIAVAGLRRYGLHASAATLARELLDAAARFPHARLPEVFAGIDRRGRARPVPLPASVSQVPPAWAAGARAGDQDAAIDAGLLTEASGPQAWAAAAVIAALASPI
jgi:glycogen debranching enzyme